MALIPTFIFGTRPEYLKIKPLALSFHSQSLDFQFIHVLQHTDIQIDIELQKYLLQVPIYTNNSVSRLTQLTSSIPLALEKYISTASFIIVQGDTATAFFAALSAFHHKIPIYHLEAGLRTYDLDNPFPEEAYRSMISQITTYHLCPDFTAKKNLQDSHIHKNTYVVGNTILDLVKSYGYTIHLGKKIPITIHRRENWNQISAIFHQCILLAKNYTDFEFEWILHPNPMLQKECITLFAQSGVPNNFYLVQPLDHPTLCKILSQCYCVITDSGGLQEEASFLGKTCFVVRKTTERTALQEPYIYMVPSPQDLFTLFQTKSIQLLTSSSAYGKGNSCEKILDIMKYNGHI